MAVALVAVQLELGSDDVATPDALQRRIAGAVAEAVTGPAAAAAHRLVVLPEAIGLAALVAHAPPRARDAVTRQLKVFLLARLEIVSNGTEAIAASRPAAPRARADQDLLAATAEELRLLGWHVVASSRGISLYRIDSRGTPLRIADSTATKGLAWPRRDCVPGPDARQTINEACLAYALCVAVLEFKQLS